MKKIIVLNIVFSLLASSSLASIQVLGGSARLMGLNNVFIHRQADLGANHRNPAALSWSGQKILAVNALLYYYNYQYLSLDYLTKINNSPMQIYFNRFQSPKNNVGEYDIRTQFGAMFNWLMMSNLMVGINLKVLNHYSYGSIMNWIMADLAMKMTITKYLTAGALVYNFLMWNIDGTSNSTNNLSYLAYINYRLMPLLMIAVQMHVQGTTDPIFSVAAEYMLSNMMAITMGINQYTLGWGLNMIFLANMTLFFSQNINIDPNSGSNGQSTFSLGVTNGF